MNKKNIVIVGYPKSGTTWLSRLVAQLLNCPLQGDWGFENLDAEYQEGLDRNSYYSCFKSHHTADGIAVASTRPIHKIIYIIRDPRDIVISGMNFFDFNVHKKARLRKMKLKPLQHILLAEISEENKKKQMIKAVLKGNSTLNQWLKTSWEDHVKGYEKTNALIVKYEDLLENTEATCSTITKHLEIDIPQPHIEKSIKDQSFQRKKQVLLEINHPTQNLMREGKSGYWKSQLTSEELLEFKKHMGATNKFYIF